MLSSCSSSSSSCIILDDEDDGPPSSPTTAPSSEQKAAPSSAVSSLPSLLAQKEEHTLLQGPSGGSGPKPPAPGKDPSSLKAENERLFAEFLNFCAQHTTEHPEVMSYLTSRHQKTNPKYLASAEFHNVLGRCLTRVQARSSKVYVYINEICTVFKAHSQKKKPTVLSSASEATVTEEATPVDPTKSRPVDLAQAQVNSKRRIRYLENLLRVYAQEIQRLQEQELDLEDLDREDSAYLQESRLKRRMMRIFQRLCELKDCNSLTGRVIEQRIPYRGTRYPEINRRVERLINHHPEAFPDYADILKAVQKANGRHSLGLSKPQMEKLAAEAFREVGSRLQERRRLDLIYNFGSHLTDQYRPNTDPALMDAELARRLRQNQKLSVKRLEEVITQYAERQDESREAEWHRKEEARGRTSGEPQGESASPMRPAPEATTHQGSQGPTGRGTEMKEEEEEEDEEEEDEEEEESSESEIEVDLATCLQGGEEEEETLAPEEETLAHDVEADQCMDLEGPDPAPYSSAEEEEEEEEAEEEEEEEDNKEDPEVKSVAPIEEEVMVGEGANGPPGNGLKASPTPAALGQSPSQQLLLETEDVLPLEAGETPPPSPLTPSHVALMPKLPPSKRPLSLEDGAVRHPSATMALRDLNGQPPRKRARREQRVSNSSSCIEVHSTGSSEGEEEGENGEVLFASLPPLSPVPAADSTCEDSPSAGLVTSSQGSPPARPQHQKLLAKVWKTSVATQCDPEEIIILSDSD